MQLQQPSQNLNFSLSVRTYFLFIKIEMSQDQLTKYYNHNRVSRCTMITQNVFILLLLHILIGVPIEVLSEFEQFESSLTKI